MSSSDPDPDSDFSDHDLDAITDLGVTLVAKVELSCSYLSDYLQSIDEEQSEYLFSRIQNHPDEDYDVLHFLAVNIGLEIVAQHRDPNDEGRVFVDIKFNEDVEALTCKDVLLEIYNRISEENS